MITAEQIKSVNERIKKIEVKGKAYACVPARVQAFREICPDGCIETDIMSLENGVVTMKAVVRNGEGRVIASGLAQEKESSSYINKTSFIENCETSAVGRALGFLGLGSDEQMASAEELANAINNQSGRKNKLEAPQEEGQQEEAPQEELDPIYCENCMKPIIDGKIRGEIYTANDIAEKSLEKYKRFLCYSCMKQEAAKTAERVARQYESREDGEDY